MILLSRSLDASGGHLASGIFEKKITPACYCLWESPLGGSYQQVLVNKRVNKQKKKKVINKFKKKRKK
jgi:hypothetical protein